MVGRPLQDVDDEIQVNVIANVRATDATFEDRSVERAATIQVSPLEDLGHGEVMLCFADEGEHHPTRRSIGEKIGECVEMLA